MLKKFIAENLDEVNKMNEEFIGIKFYDFSFPQGMREVQSYLGKGEYYCPLVESKHDIDYDYYCSWNEQTISNLVAARKEAGLDVKTGKRV